MKKYILSIMAVALAFAFSAFTPDTKQSKRTDERMLFWYTLNGNLIGEPLNSGVQATKTEVSAEAGCPDVSGPDCARGYTSPQDEDETAPPSSGADSHIREFN